MGIRGSWANSHVVYDVTPDLFSSLTKIVTGNLLFWNDYEASFGSEFISVRYFARVAVKAAHLYDVCTFFLCTTHTHTFQLIDFSGAGFFFGLAQSIANRKHIGATFFGVLLVLFMHCKDSLDKRGKNKVPFCFSSFFFSFPVSLVYCYNYNNYYYCYRQNK